LFIAFIILIGWDFLSPFRLHRRDFSLHFRLVGIDSSPSPPRLTGRNPVFTSVFRAVLPTSGGHDSHISQLQYKRVNITLDAPLQ
ncbi:hypothetical protein TNCT_630111, partial [Trichonephila clavata]